jgi:valyl-tRNA synthetase
MDLIIGLISAIRGIRGETNVKPGVTIDEVFFLTDSEEARAAIEAGRSYIARLAKVDTSTIVSPQEAGKVEGAATSVHEGVEIRIPLAGLIDVAEEMKRVKKDLDRVEDDIAHVRGKLDNEQFVQNAPEDIVEGERAKLEAYLEEKEALEASIRDLEQLED